jgi:hypothetical protein
MKMSLITKEVEVGLSGTSIQWYKNKGYIVDNQKTIIVKIEDLQNKSGTKVDVKCDNCYQTLKVTWYNYSKCIHENNTYYCNQCSAKLFGVKKANDTKLLKGTSFQQWCIDNNQHDLLERWDYQLNKCRPDEISYASQGFNKKGYWLKCLNNLEHKSELRNIQAFTCGQQAGLDCNQCNSFYQWCIANEHGNILDRWDYELNICDPINVSKKSHGYNDKGYWFKCSIDESHESELKSIDRFVSGQKGSIECNQCKMIFFTHPYLIKYFKNEEDSKKYSICSNKKALLKCPDCGYEKLKTINDFGKDGFGCPKCSDGVPYSEKFICNLLEQHNINFQCQKIFDWSNKRYDFYVPDYNILIETHGIQHYEQSPQFGFKTLRNEQENDSIKLDLALKNGIKYYISLDCRESSLDWIKNSVIKSDFFTLLNIVDNTNWLKCHEYAVSSRVKEVCDLWNSGLNNVQQIANKIKLYKTTVVKYLKQGAELAWCNYDQKEESIKNINKLIQEKIRKVICLNDNNKIFNSLTDAGKFYNISNSCVGNCCSNHRPSGGKHPITNEPLHWMYYDEYLKLQNNNQIEILQDNQDIQIQDSDFIVSEVINQ